MKQLVEDLREICSDLEGTPATESNLGVMRDAISSGFRKIADSIEESYKSYEASKVSAPAAARVPEPEPPAQAESPAAT